METSKEKFLNKVVDRSLTVGIYGLGYVGIPLASRCSEAGFKVVGFDISGERVANLNGGVSPIKHISNEKISQMLSDGFEATEDFSRTLECDALIICVPTPLSLTREPDLSYVVATMDNIRPYLRAGQLLSLESTTWPGTTDEILLPYVVKSDLVVGENFFLVYSPEREDPGNADFSTQTIPKILGGHTDDCSETGSALYNAFIDRVVTVSSTRASEMVKLLENIHRSVNIGLVNEMKVICQEMGLDVFEVIEAAATKPFGFTAYYPGPGIGGHCIPIDPFYLTWKAREYGVQTKFIELAGEVNASMPDHVVNRTMHALNDRGLAMSKSNILVLGIAYKRDVDDMRESPSVFVMERLRARGAVVEYHDPNVPKFPKMREHHFDLSSVELDAKKLSSYDAVMLLTDHSCFDYEFIEANARLIIDTRGKFRDSAGENIVTA